MRILPALLALFFLACGQEPASSPSLANPSDAFDGLYETKPVDAGLCGQDSSLGCGQVVTSGSLVNGSFVFENLRATCGINSQGLYVQLANSLDDQPTFQVNISIWRATSPPKVQLCSGMKIVTGTGDPAVEAGSCEVIAKVHSESLVATTARSCQIQFQNQTQWEGTIHCRLLEDGPHYLIIDGASQFKCPV